MAEPDLPTTLIAYLELMLAEAITGEPDWSQIADWARSVEAVAVELQS